MNEPKEPAMNGNECLGSGVLFVPVMTIERFAELVGLTAKTVEAQVHRGYYPTTKIGKRRMINVAAYYQELTTQH